jgi:hypothetical protein
MKKNLKLSFLNPPHADWSLSNTLTYISCKSYYKENGKYNNNIDWLDPLYKWNKYQSIEEVIHLLEDADIIMFSSYVWNYDIIDQISKEIKKRTPNKITLLGGPHIGDIKTRPFYDFICKATKPGEVFLKDFLDSYIDNEGKPKLNDISWAIGSNKSDVYKLDLKKSVYRDNFDHLKELFTYADENQLEKFIALETTRGCPYSCVYCEWGGGIGTKVYKKPTDIIFQDIDAIIELGLNSAYLTDANFGIFFERDIEIYRYAYKKGLRLTDVSTFKSKDLNKRIELIDAWFEIVGNDAGFQRDRNGISLSKIPNVAIQSISDEAMRIAKRSDLTFSDKIKLSEYIRDKCSQKKYPYPNIEMILSMPGSTKEDFYREAVIFWNFNSRNERYDYMVLPDSEINNKIYQELYSIKTVEVIEDLVDEEGPSDTTQFYKNKKITFKTIISCHSFTEEDYKEMWFMNITTSYLLYKIYPTFQHAITPPEFLKMCYNIIINIEDFKPIKKYIDDLFDTNTPPKSIRKINGRSKKEVVDNFLESNKMLLISELTVRI